jgi:hypothetical protein
MREFFVVWLAKAQRRKEKTLGGFAALREYILFYSRKDAKELDKPLAL